MKRGSRQIVKGRLYGLFWIGEDRRESVPMPGVDPRDDAAVKARCEMIADIAERMVAAGRREQARDFCVQLGAAKSEKLVAKIMKAVNDISNVPAASGETVKSFGDRWVSGDLHRLYPDHVKAKKHPRDDRGILNRYVNKVIGSLPMKDLKLEDCERVMARVPARLSSARRRHVAQVLVKLLNIAVYPAKLIQRSPLPKGFLPKISSTRAKSWLYPNEEASLMGCIDVPIEDRLFYGMMAREGLRFSEAHSLEWSDLDLETGVINLDANKTDRPRSWALDEGVRRVLRVWKLTTPRGPFVGCVSASHPADRFRRHLKTAKITRAELFERSAQRIPIRAHDLRATFVTLALANGKTETWVSDRTGHESTLMIERYRRQARMATELELGPLRPLDEVFRWESPGEPVDSQTIVKHERGRKGVSR